jgi:DNA-binding MarR family transcriptional regulator
MSGGPGPQRAARGARLSVEAWEALFRAQVAVMRRLERDDIWDEVTMREYDVLVQVAGSPDGRARLRDLNVRILLSQRSLSRLVERLESRGLVSR